MAIKKSELYSSLWQSCDELRGGMDASQYKDYVLVMLFIKYISDKYANKMFAPIQIPKGASFADMVKMKGKTDIGERINTEVIQPLKDANPKRLTSMPDFNDPVKLGEGKEMQDRLTNLIAIFEKPELNFENNRADNDDILGDAYEYLMRHFATESGKSKGQFYTPAEVSRVMAQIIGIREAVTTASTTVYDPTCGSGSLLLKVAEVAPTEVTLYGQEKDAATTGLANMNMVLHNYPTAEIRQGNTLASPKFPKPDAPMQQFDFVIANPPFSDKRWENGMNLPKDEPHRRFEGFGTPPSKNGDYAYLLHIVRSMKRNGKGAVILPHGVLFRGNAEAGIRESLIKKGYVKGIIGLPANLFYGTGIPACIIILDKENATSRKGIFMIDAGKGFVKDGNKNRLREQDIHKISDAFTQQLEIKGYSRMVSFTEIEDNEYNLNIPRYIDNQEKEDIQDIAGHLKGGIPLADIDDLAEYWEVYPTLRNDLFEALRPNYVQLKVPQNKLKNAIYTHEEFVAFSKNMQSLFEAWKTETVERLLTFGKGQKPKPLIHNLSERLLDFYSGKPLVNKYNIYQILLTYWNETMQDDLYLIAADGWKAEAKRILVPNKRGKMVDKGWACDLLPKPFIVQRFFEKEQAAITAMEGEQETLNAQVTELEEEHSSEDGHFADLDKVSKTAVKKELRDLEKELKDSPDDGELLEKKTVFETYLDLQDDISALKKKIKAAEQELDDAAYQKYPTLTESEIKDMVLHDKWLTAIATQIQSDIDHISQRLTNRIKELAERYATPLPMIDKKVSELESRVMAHLSKMGF